MAAAMKACSPEKENEAPTYLSWEDLGGSCLRKLRRRRARRGTNDAGESLSNEEMPEVWIGVVAVLRRRSLRPPRVAVEIEFPET